MAIHLFVFNSLLSTLILTFKLYYQFNNLKLLFSIFKHKGSKLILFTYIYTHKMFQVSHLNQYQNHKSNSMKLLLHLPHQILT